MTADDFPANIGPRIISILIGSVSRVHVSTNPVTAAAVNFLLD
jgi:hypothetical protein